jgi:uncharacterized membrane protein YraQ (UPF0718 family)
MSLPPPDLPPPDAAAHTPVAAAPPPAPAPPPKRVAPRPPAEDDSGPELDRFTDLLRDAVVYPWRRGGAYILVPGAVLALGFSIAAWAPLIGLISSIIGACYFSAFYFQIVESTCAGRHTVPDWPEFSDLYDDLIRPGLQMAAIFLFCGLIWSGLWWLVTQVHEFSDMEDASRVARWLWQAVFWPYFPMAVLGVVLQGTVGGALPQHVIPAIIRCLPGYLAGMAALAGIHLGMNLLHAQVRALPWAGLLLGWLLSICLLVMQARLTGTMGVRHARRIVPG